jgi:hypothetical protein
MTESLFPPAICRNGIPIGVSIRRKFDVGDHPFVVEKSKVDSIDKIRNNPQIFKYYSGLGQRVVPYYRPFNPQTETQQAWRSVFANAVAAWQALPESEKKVWRAKGIRRSKMGYSLFLSRYLDQHKI